MAFAPALAEIVRTSSGVLWVGLGVALLLRPRQSVEARWFGAFLALNFPNLIVGNVVLMIQPPSQPAIDLSLRVESVFDALAALALAGFLRSEARAHPSAKRALILGIACALVADALVLWSLPSTQIPFGLAPSTLRILGVLPMFTLMGAASWHFAERAIHARAPTPWFYLAAMACYPIAYANEVILFQVGPAIGVLSVVLLTTAPVLLTIVALFRARAAQGRTALALGAFLIATGLTALVVRSFWNGNYDVRGPARIVAFGFLAAAALKMGWFGDISHRSRGAFFATISLPALLVVAQVGQNFLSAQYGLIMGGIVAGALFFAAKPIERALEGRREGRERAHPDGAREEAYRKALRFALRDRHVSREEELHLHEIAEQMGLSGRRAHELMVEVERESFSPSAPSERR